MNCTEFFNNKTGRNLSTMEVGNIIESLVIGRAIYLGYNIFSPINDGCEIDYILCKDSLVEKIQVKSCAFDDDKIMIGASRTIWLDGKHDKIKYDQLIVSHIVTYVPIIEKFLKIPLIDFGDKEGLTLRLVPRKNPHHDPEVFAEKTLLVNPAGATK